MKEPNRVVDFSNLFKLIRVNEFLVKLKLALMLMMRGGLHQILLHQTPMRVRVLHVRLLTYMQLVTYPDTPGVRALPTHSLLLPHVLRGSAAYPRHVVDQLHLIGIHVVHVHHHHRWLLLRDYFWLQVFFLLVIATVTEIIMIVAGILKAMGVGLLLGT